MDQKQYSSALRNVEQSILLVKEIKKPLLLFEAMELSARVRV